MDINIFVNTMTKLIQQNRIDDCVIVMKRLWIRMSIHDIKVLAKSAHKYNSLDGDLPFPKDIGGVVYQSAGDYIYRQLDEEQQEAIAKSTINNITVE
jgi:hypothetical protein